MEISLSPKINICFFTRRQSIEASINLVNLFEVSRKLDIQVLIAYGGPQKSTEFYSLKENIKFFNDEKERIHLFCNESSNERMKWVYSFESDWIIFVSDDDSFTTNHIPTLIGEIRNAKETTSHIAPQAYFLTDKGKTRVQPIEQIFAENPLDRVAILLEQKFQGLRFYSALRTEHAKKITLELIQNDFLPTYTDQLIVFYCAIKGNFSVAKNFSCLIYDISSWSTEEAAISSDLNGYKIKNSIIFHEIYWIRDYFRCLKNLDLQLDFFGFFREYCLKMIDRSIRLFNPRLGVLNQPSDPLFGKYRSHLEMLSFRVSRSTGWGELGTALDFNSDQSLLIDKYIKY